MLSVMGLAAAHRSDMEDDVVRVLAGALALLVVLGACSIGGGGDELSAGRSTTAPEVVVPSTTSSRSVGEIVDSYVAERDARVGPDAAATDCIREAEADMADDWGEIAVVAALDSKAEQCASAAAMADLPYDLSPVRLLDEISGWEYDSTPFVGGPIAYEVSTSVADSPPGKSRLHVRIAVPEIYVTSVGTDPARNPPDLDLPSVGLRFDLTTGSEAVNRDIMNAYTANFQVGVSKCDLQAWEDTPVMDCFRMDSGTVYEFALEADETVIMAAEGRLASGELHPSITLYDAPRLTGSRTLCRIYLQANGESSGGCGYRYLDTDP